MLPFVDFDVTFRLRFPFVCVCVFFFFSFGMDFASTLGASVCNWRFYLICLQIGRDFLLLSVSVTVQRVFKALTNLLFYC